jgi:hypothetical protein
MKTPVISCRQLSAHAPSVRRGLANAARVILLAASGTAGVPAAAALTADLPLGVACADFALRVIYGSPQVYREFKDKNGNIVRTLNAGKGAPLTFTNLATGATLSVRPNGSVAHTAFNADGSTTVVYTGHNGLILFPTDVPAGPSTTLYVGRVVTTIDTSGVFTLEGTSGTAVDVCATLSS